MLIELFGHYRVLRLLQPTVTSSIGRYSRQCCGHTNERRSLSYSRMLDMGGAPSANSDETLLRTVNASKNSRLQAVAFDFQTLININDGKKNVNNEVALDQMPEDLYTEQGPQKHRELAPATIVDVDRVKKVASLLNVDLGSSPNGTPSASKQPKSALESKLKDHDPSANDIRMKYASKLKGGLAGIELAKSQVEETPTPGDAAGHLAARKIAIMEGAANIPNGTNNAATRWLPSLAATQLLTLLTHRSISIVLLPTLDTKTTKQTEVEDEPRMEDFKAQLKNVIINNIIPKFDDDNSNDEIKNAIRTGILNELDVDPNKVLVVSNRDQYLRVARDLGMNICRLQPKNARRGSITAHYTVSTVREVQDVVNEINGISFNTVLNR